MSQFGQKVVAVIDTNSAFGTTIRQLKQDVTTLDTRFNTLTAGAPELLDTLQEIADAIADDPNFWQTIQNDRQAITLNLNNETQAREAAITAVQGLITTLTSTVSGKANLTGATFTGNVLVNKQWPDLELKSNEEKRVLFTDAGGGATGAIKNVSSDVDIFAGGVAAGDKKLSVSSTGVNVVDRLTTGQFNIPTTIPTSPVDGDIYFDKTALKLKIYVDDGSSTQWVQL